MTIVLTPFGKIMTNWGNHNFDILPDKDRAVQFAANMQKFYKEKAFKFLYDGRMIKPLEIQCSSEEYPKYGNQTTVIPDVYTSAWEKDGEKAQIFVNHTLKDVTVKVDGKEIVVPSLGAEIIKL